MKAPRVPVRDRKARVIETLREAAQRDQAYYIRPVLLLEPDEIRDLLALIDAYEFENVNDAVRLCMASTMSANPQQHMTKAAYHSVLAEVRHISLGKVADFFKKLSEELADSRDAALYQPPTTGE